MSLLRCDIGLTENAERRWKASGEHWQAQTQIVLDCRMSCYRNCPQWRRPLSIAMVTRSSRPAPKPRHLMRPILKWAISTILVRLNTRGARVSRSSSCGSGAGTRAGMEVRGAQGWANWRYRRGDVECRIENGHRRETKQKWNCQTPLPSPCQSPGGLQRVPTRLMAARARTNATTASESRRDDAR